MSEQKSDENLIVSSDNFLPNKLTIIPLTSRPIFPGIFTPLMISNQEDIKAVEQAYGGDNHIGIVMLKNEVTDASYKDLCQVGTAAKIIKKITCRFHFLTVYFKYDRK